MAVSIRWWMETPWKRITFFVLTHRAARHVFFSTFSLYEFPKLRRGFFDANNEREDAENEGRTEKNSSFKVFVLLTPTFLSRFHFVRLIRLQFGFCLDYVLRGWNRKGGEGIRRQGQVRGWVVTRTAERTFWNKQLIGCGFDQKTILLVELDQSQLF